MQSPAELPAENSEENNIKQRSQSANCREPSHAVEDCGLIRIDDGSFCAALSMQLADVCVEPKTTRNFSTRCA